MEIIKHKLSFCSENSVWLSSSIFFFRLQVIYKSQTSNDLDCKFSASLKAGKSRQVQTMISIEGKGT